MNWANWTKVFASIWLILFSIHITNFWSLHPVTLIVMSAIVFISAMFELINQKKDDK